MNLKFNIYRKRYASVILASYLLLVSISILHYHHINIQAGYYAITSNNGGNFSDPFDKMDGLTHECTIQHFTSTIINYNFLTVFDVIKETSEQNFTFNEIIRLHRDPQYNNNPLRAPPLFS